MPRWSKMLLVVPVALATIRPALEPGPSRGAVAIDAPAQIQAPEVILLNFGACDGDPEVATLETTPSQVRVEVVATVTPGGDACGGAIRVELPEPLADRELVDISTGDVLEVKASSASGGDRPWRLLADRDQTGPTYWTQIATDQSQYDRLWDVAGLEGALTDVDLDEQVVVHFGAVHGSGSRACSQLTLADVTIADAGELPVLHPIVVQPFATPGQACQSDANPHAFVVAMDRSFLPDGPFAVQLQAEDPPSGVREERLEVRTDLTAPGSTASDDQLRRGGANPDSPPG